MAIDTIVSGLNVTQFNGPLQMPLWDGEDGLRAGQFAWDEDGTVDPIAGPGEIVWNGTAWERNTTSASIPSLQQVTDVGAITDVSMSVNTTGLYDGTPSTEALLAHVSANNDAAQAITSIRAFSIDNGFATEYQSQILMQGHVISLVISTGVSLDIMDDGGGKLFTILSGGVGIQFANGVQDRSGNGVPEGSITAPTGSTYRQLNGTAGSVFWVKQSGLGNTGWAPIG